MVATVRLGGVDITALCLGDIRIKRKANAAALATFTYRPTSTPPYPPQMIRQAVEIDWKSGGAAYRGEVNEAVWDLATRTYAIQASDFFQERFEGQSNATIDGIVVGGKYTENVFGPRRDGWQYAENLMSTTPRNFFIDSAGAMQSVAWAPAATTFTYGLSGLLNDGAYVLDMAKGRDLKTRFTATYKNRFIRWKRRKHNFTWSGLTGTGAWCQWAQNQGYQLPTREMIASAASGNGWINEGISFSRHPDTGVYCVGAVNWVIQPEARESVAIGATWNAYRKWVQTVTEEYSINFDVTSAQPAFGIHVVERTVSSDAPQGEEAWDSDTTIGLPAGAWATDSLGDDKRDLIDDTVRDADLSALWRLAYTTLYSGFRRNYVQVEVPLEKTMQLSHSALISTSDIDAKGLIEELEHILTTRRQTTLFKVAICYGSTGASDAETTPAHPSSDPTHAAPASSTAIPTVIGGCNNSPDFDDTLPNAFYSNLNPNKCADTTTAPTPAQTYPVKFVVTGPDIEDPARDEFKAPVTVNHTFGFPADTLVLK